MFTPPKSGSSCYCLCQREDTGWYLICSFQIAGCLTYYHPQCVGLGQLKSQDDGVRYSNCEDGESYMCPLCETRNLNFDEQENTVTSLPCRENLPKPQKNERSCMNERKTYLSSDDSCEIPEENLSHITGKTGLNEWDSAAVNLLPNSIDANPTQIDHNKNGSDDTLQHLSDCESDLLRDKLNDVADMYSTTCFSEEDTGDQNEGDRLACEGSKIPGTLFRQKKMIHFLCSSVVKMKNLIRKTLIVCMMSLTDQNKQLVKLTRTPCLFLTINSAG